MGHRVALYRVRVRKKWARKEDESRLLGDFDEAGADLAGALAGMLQDFEKQSDDRDRTVRSLGVAIVGEDLQAVLAHGQTGVVADIRGRGSRYFRQIADDEQAVKCACLFRLPPAERIGALVVHINNGRGVIGLLSRGLRERFRERYGEETLDLVPVVSVNALQEAVNRNMIEKVTLVRYEHPQDRAMRDTTKWVRANEIGKLELNISALGRGRTLVSNLIRRYRRNPDAFDEIVEFEGLRFDQAKVEVVLPDQTRRTFNIERPDVGHAITRDLPRLEVDQDGDPIEESLFGAMGQLAAEVIG